MKKKQDNLQYLLKLVQIYAVVFILISFTITCCMMLFLNVMAKTTKIPYTEEQINYAAKLTFVNVIVLALIYSVTDFIRLKLTVQRPVKRIIASANRMAEGDFTVRIPQMKNDSFYGFNQIIDCLNTLAEELSEKEMLSGDFIANVSHELKTPLSIMQNYGTILQQPDLPEEKRIEYAMTITAASRRLSDLVTNILRLNKLENQQLLPETKKYDLGEQLCECLLNFEPAWESKRLCIETDIQDEVRVNADSDMMALVWNNLFSNAIKFTDEGGRIFVSLRQEGTNAVVTVSDSGCGIPVDVGKRIFDKFYQGDTSRATQGNGLGLSLVKKIIDISDSEISVESELGKGSTFTITIHLDKNKTTGENTYA